MTEQLPAVTFDELRAAKYVLLTTFTKEGQPKPAAVWAAPDGNELLVWTETSKWTVRRIRNTERVLLATCDVRGNPASAAIEGTAQILDEVGTRRARAAITHKYGMPGRLLIWAVLLRLRGTKGTVGLAIKAQ